MVGTGPVDINVLAPERRTVNSTGCFFGKNQTAHPAKHSQTPRVRVLEIPISADVGYLMGIFLVAHGCFSPHLFAMSNIFSLDNKRTNKPKVYNTVL